MLDNVDIPSLSDFKEKARELSNRIYCTPTQIWDTPHKSILLGGKCSVHLKLELFQKTGSFKARGALSVIDSLTPEQRSQGIVAGTGGNHGIAVAYAAQSTNIDAKLVIPETINAFRKRSIEAYGASITQVSHVSEVFDRMRQIAKEENRYVVHPFEDPKITLGTGTLGLEFMTQIPDLDVVIVPIGGGGLASGVSCAIKQIKPDCKVYGVEPAGANSMTLSLAAGKAVSLPEKPQSIADSLSAPNAEPYSFAVCQKYIDDVVLVSDDEIKQAMKTLFEDIKIATEPAGAAATAALIGPLRERCVNKKVGVIVCGSNIDTDRFFEILSKE